MTVKFNYLRIWVWFNVYQGQCVANIIFAKLKKSNSRLLFGDLGDKNHSYAWAVLPT